MKKILLCHDTQVVLDLLNTYLHDAGYIVFAVRTLPAAMEQYAKGGFDLVISDDLGGNGVEWLGLLHIDKQLVLNTSATTQGDPTMPSLPKRFTKDEFLAKLRELIGPARHEKSPDTEGCGSA